jgi:prepilin-type N-terminal cleavage/methylation domain-containing protein
MTTIMLTRGVLRGFRKHDKSLRFQPSKQMATTTRHLAKYRPLGIYLRPQHAFTGYSLPEVMIASTVLAIVVASSVGTLTESGKSFNRSRERDAISTLIAKDLEEVRAAAYNYNEPVACSDARLNQFADGQVTFVPDASRCNAGTLAEGLVATNPDLVSSSTLTIPENVTDISLGGVTISRTITASGNELEAKYSSISSSSGNQPVYQQALIVPESTGWCA